MVRNLLVVSVAAGSLVALAACTSSGANTGSGISSVPPSASAAPSTPVPSATVTATATSVPSKPAKKPATKACTVADVTVKASTGQGAAGTQVQRFIVTNTSSGTCTMEKYPFIAPYGLLKQGNSKVEATLDDITVGPIASGFGDLGDAGGLRTVAPGDTSVFFLKWSDVPVGTKACDHVDGFDFRPPQDQSENDNKTVKFTFTACGGAMQVSQMLSPSIGS